jgi:hypothetical protein
MIPQFLPTEECFLKKRGSEMNSIETDGSEIEVSKASSHLGRNWVLAYG